MIKLLHSDRKQMGSCLELSGGDEADCKGAGGRSGGDAMFRYLAWGFGYTGVYIC